MPERLRKGTVFNKKSQLMAPDWGRIGGGCMGLSSAVRTKRSPKFMLQMVPSAVGEGAFRAACPQLTSSSIP